MRTEYKRDMNHNYLILYGENEINTDSYQVRMLVGNVIPSILKCRIQGMDGNFLIYFDITSKQALNILYEDRKMKLEDLQLIFGGFVKAMEDAAEYLMNPGQFVLSADYIYADIEKKKIYFCMMPGYEKDIKEQFQLLTEYILPKIDHEDGKAVILGYGVYKRAMEDSFHLEHIKEELYKIQGQDDRKTDVNEREKVDHTERNSYFQNDREQEDYWENDEIKGEFIREGENSKQPGTLYKAGMIVLAAVLLCAVTAAALLGYLPYMETGTLLGIIIVLAAGVMLVVHVMKNKRSSGTKNLENMKKESERKTNIKTNIKTGTDVETRTGMKEAGSELEDSEYNIWFNREKRNTSGINEIKRQSITEEKWEDRLYENLKCEPSEKEQTGKEISKTKISQTLPDYGETIVLSAGTVSGPASLVSKEPGELATIYLNEDLTVIGKLENACDAVISLPTVSRIHAKIRKREEVYYLTDMNSRNGTAVNGRLLRPEEEYQLEPEDEVDFAQARYIFLP